MRNIFIGLFALASSIQLVSGQRAEDYKITSLPGINIQDLNFEQYAGHIEISNETNANIFFWMVESEIKTEPEKLVIWLNGGPGCSSMDGLFLENGPFRVNKDLTLSLNEGGWQNYATNIYVDQPVGTGFSFANTDSYMHNMEQISTEFIAFLEKLFDVFPQLQKQDLYIAGESYAGTYIPYFAASILKQNKKYNLKGIAIGNGWISPEHQYNAYYDYSVKMKLVENDRLDLMSNHLKYCQERIKEKESIHIGPCERILSDIMDSSTHEDKNGDRKCINIYDVRLKEESYPECGATWPYELEDVTKYLRLADVKSAIHANKQPLGWKECTSLVSTELRDDDIPAYYLLPDLLKEIQVLLFSGEYDLICNYVGTEYLIGNMTWNNAKGFGKGIKREDWKIDNSLVGYYMEDRNLSYVLIKDGSHMVPYDRPIECLDMINRFMNVGNNEVRGKKSQVGNRQTVNKPETTTKTSQGSASPTTIHEDDSSTANDDEDVKENPWNRYYSWGTTTLVVVILFALGLCCCWYRQSKRPSAGSAALEFGGAPQRQREDLKPKKTGVFGYIKQLLNRRKQQQQQRKFRLDDNDESNELDELVIETPTLFEADEDSDSDSHHQTTSRNHQHFAIDDDEEEDDFEDFADFDDGEALTQQASSKKYNKKRH